jgi:hypothetical protein
MTGDRIKDALLVIFRSSKKGERSGDNPPDATARRAQHANAHCANDDRDD